MSCLFYLLVERLRAILYPIGSRDVPQERSSTRFFKQLFDANWDTKNRVLYLFCLPQTSSHVDAKHSIQSSARAAAQWRIRRPHLAPFIPGNNRNLYLVNATRRMEGTRSITANYRSGERLLSSMGYHSSNTRTRREGDGGGKAVASCGIITLGPK